MDEKLKNFYELFTRRKSVRDFSERDIDNEVLDRILEIGRRSPSAANCQPWHFIVLSKKDRGDFDSLLQRNFSDAPVIIVGCAEKEKAWVRKADGMNYAWVDVSIALTEMIAAATAEGLGTCWIAAFDPEKVKTVLRIPPRIDVIAAIAMGYPKEPLMREEKRRKDIKEIVHYNSW
jgi:nitroreductase